MFDAIDSGKELEFKKLIIELTEDAKSLSLSELIDDILDKSGMRKEYEEEDSLENETRLESLEEFKSVAINFEENGIYDLETFLESVMLVSDKGQYTEEDDRVAERAKADHHQQCRHQRTRSKCEDEG